MKKFNKTIFLWTIAAVLGALPSPKAAANTDKIAVVVRADGALEGLGLKDIRAIYTGEKLFIGSVKIEPLFNSNEAVAGSFFKKVLEKTKAQYKKIWNSKAFVDALTAPEAFPDSSDILRMVYKSESAIGFVAESDISPAQRKYIKVLYLAE